MPTAEPAAGAREAAGSESSLPWDAPLRRHRGAAAGTATAGCLVSGSCLVPLPCFCPQRGTRPAHRQEQSQEPQEPRQRIWQNPLPEGGQTGRGLAAGTAQAAEPRCQRRGSPPGLEPAAVDVAGGTGSPPGCQGARLLPNSQARSLPVALGADPGEQLRAPWLSASSHNSRNAVRSLRLCRFRAEDGSWPSPGLGWVLVPITGGAGQGSRGLPGMWRVRLGSPPPPCCDRAHCGGGHAGGQQHRPRGIAPLGVRARSRHRTSVGYRRARPSYVMGKACDKELPKVTYVSPSPSRMLGDLSL